MSCCRSRKKRLTHQPIPCKNLEGGGAGSLVWPVSTEQGVRLIVKTPEGLLELGSFVAAYNCDGPTARLIKRNLPTLQLAVQDKSILNYRNTGISVSNVLSMGQKILRRKNAGVPSHP